MKICPQCQFANEEQFPTCVMCHCVLIDAPSLPAADPNHPEHEQRRLSEMRRDATSSQLWTAAIVYAAVITITALCPGLVFDRIALQLYFASGILVGAGVARGYLGQFTASFAQAALSIVLIFTFGPLQFLIIFMLVCHIIVPGFLWHWVDMIHNAQR
jgi:uncharacterized membrane protein